MDSLPRCTPESVGVPSRALGSVVEQLDRRVEYPNSIMVLRHGRVCLEAYWRPFSAAQPHALFSLSKSLTSCAIGLAQEEGLLTLGDRIVRYFPEYESQVADARMLRTTIEDLLTMRSGHDVCARGAMVHDPAGDWARGFLASGLRHEPGTRFVYDSGASYMLAAILRRAAGRNVREYLLPRLFQPLGIVPGPWECSPDGTNCGGWGLSLCTEDIARFAQLLLQKGSWRGRQLLPAAYLAQATRAQADTSANLQADWQQGYGYHFWMSRHGFRADGASGQYALVLPCEDLAIAVTSCAAEMDAILDILWDTLLPALQEQPLPEDPAALRELESRISGLAIQLPPVHPELAAPPAARRQEFAANPQGIRGCQVEFDGRRCALTILFADRSEQIPAGLGFAVESAVRLLDDVPHRVSAAAGWTAPGRLTMQVLYLDTTYRDTYEIDLDGAGGTLSRTSRCATFRPVFPRLRRLPEAGPRDARSRPSCGQLIYAASESDADLWYISGFSAPDPFLWIRCGSFEAIVVSSMEAGRARKQAASRLQVIDGSRLQEALGLPEPPGRSADAVIAAIAGHLRCSRWEVPADFPLELAERLARRRLRIVPRRDFFPSRAVKSEAEIGWIEEGVRLAEAGMYRAFQVLREASILPDMGLRWRDGVLTSEILRGEIDGEIARRGGVAFGTIAACGVQAADPHQAGSGPLRAGQPIVLDIFPRVVATGYFGDLTRTVVKGQASPEVERAFQAVRQAQQATLGILKAGVTGQEAHAAAADTFARLGYRTGLVDGDQCGFIHTTGHGVGLEIHESPGLGPRNPAPLAAGNAVTVEPGLYYPQWGGIRIEDLAIVTGQGCRDLTTIPVFLEIP